MTRTFEETSWISEEYQINHRMLAWLLGCRLVRIPIREQNTSRETLNKLFQSTFEARRDSYDFRLASLHKSFSEGLVDEHSCTGPVNLRGQGTVMYHVQELTARQ